MFRVVVDGADAGYAGWWEQEHEGDPAYEIGCVIEPGWQGRGVATAVLRAVVRLAAETGDRRRDRRVRECRERGIQCTVRTGGLLARRHG